MLSSNEACRSIACATSVDRSVERASAVSLSSLMHGEAYFRTSFAARQRACRRHSLPRTRLH